MSVTLQWLGHASFKISDEKTIIYIDPWKIKGSPHDATAVLVSHGHFDHYNPDDIAKISKPETKLFAPADVTSQQSGQSIMPGQTIDLDSLKVIAVAAYNPNKQFHPKGNDWLGFIIEIDSVRIYYAGDTDLTDEMKALENIDVVLLPVGGTYTMNADEAVDAIRYIKPKLAIPYHWGDIVGNLNDAKKFQKTADCEVQILSAGQTITLDK